MVNYDVEILVISARFMCAKPLRSFIYILPLVDNNEKKQQTTNTSPPGQFI
jgi:hypothetical protein